MSKTPLKAMNFDQYNKTNNTYQNKCGDCELCTHTVNRRRVRIDSEEIVAIENIIQSHTQAEKGQVIYKTGQPFTHLYTVHSGMFKSIYINGKGEERIVEIFIPGQVMGFDGIRDGRYKTTVKAINSGSYCVIPYQQLNELAFKHKSIQNRLFKMMSEKILQFEISHSEFNARQKLVHFIKDVSELYYSRGFSPKQFPFPVSQRDLANHLGLAEETLSRTFAKLKKEEVLMLKDHQITIFNIDALQDILNT